MTVSYCEYEMSEYEMSDSKWVWYDLNECGKSECDKSEYVMS